MAKRKKKKSPVTAQHATVSASHRALMIGLAVAGGGGVIGWSLLGFTDPAGGQKSGFGQADARASMIWSINSPTAATNNGSLSNDREGCLHE